MEQGNLLDFTDDMWDYFTEKVVLTIKQIQNANEPVEAEVMKVNTPALDIIAEEILNCINGIPIHHVHYGTSQIYMYAI